MDFPTNNLVFPDSDYTRSTDHFERYLSFLEVVCILRLQNYYSIEECSAENIYQSLLEEAKEQFGSEFLSLNVIFGSHDTKLISVVMLHKDPFLPLTKDNIRIMSRELTSRAAFLEYKLSLLHAS
jgi:hypothetical protein